MHCANDKSRKTIIVFWCLIFLLRLIFSLLFPTTWYHSLSKSTHYKYKAHIQIFVRICGHEWNIEKLPEAYAIYLLSNVVMHLFDATKQHNTTHSLLYSPLYIYTLTTTNKTLVLCTFSILFPFLLVIFLAQKKKLKKLFVLQFSNENFVSISLWLYEA